MENISILKKEYKIKRIASITFVTSIVIWILLGCVSVIRYDGPYEGRVIDADTGEPIEGVIVLGVWSKEHISPGGAVSEYYDARETVTDRNGEFSIPGKGLLLASNITPIDVLIFKAGYEYLQASWLGLKIDGMLRQRVTWEGNKAIIPLKKFTMEERQRKGDSAYPPSKAIQEEKAKLMMNEIDKDRRERGLKD